MTDATIACNLLENALDTLLLAGEHAKNGSGRMLKHALATLGDGVELLLKARLEMDDWKLLFKDTARADLAKYLSGDFQSVAFDEALRRLEGSCSVTISGTHRHTLEELRRLRNRIRHFAVTTDRPAALSVIAKTYLFGLDFLNESLAYSGSADGVELVTNIRSLLGEFEEFVALRLAEIELEMGRVDATCVTCPFCLQMTLFGECGMATCLFCGYEADAQTAVDEWMSRVWAFPTPEYRQAWMRHSWGVCPCCDEAACVCAEEQDGGLGFVCLSCGQGGRLAECGTCRGLVNDEGRCGQCSAAAQPPAPAP